MPTAPPFPSSAFRVPLRPYERIFLVQNRDRWSARREPFDPKSDLVLTFDFGLAEALRRAGATVAYLDHLLDASVVEPHNADVHRFLTEWFRDREGRDVFCYRDVEIGHALRMDVWNEVSYTARLALNLMAVSQIPCQKRFVGLDDPVALRLLAPLSIAGESWGGRSVGARPEFAFPIRRWMGERIRGAGSFSARCKALVSPWLDWTLALWDRSQRQRADRPAVYVQRYYPTERVVDLLRKDDAADVFVENYSGRWGFWKERRLPAGVPNPRHRREAENLLSAWKERRVARWTMRGFPLSAHLFAEIEPIVRNALPLGLSAIDGLRQRLDGRPLRAAVHVTNLGMTNGVLLSYCRGRGIPTFLLLNGLLLHHFPEEDVTETTAINGYGESIKQSYFKGDPRVVCLGDPRLDLYAERTRHGPVNREDPTVLIGTAGFSNIDLNSFAAVEFEFMHDLLSVFRRLRSKGRRFRLVIKVRTNGYAESYRALRAEYFPDLPIEIKAGGAFSTLLRAADLYISTYSGTHFEAAASGVPSLYYKNDDERLIAPYDGKSELVTARTVDEAEDKIERFFRGDSIYDTFRSRAVLEKYVGPLDGDNARRNVNFVYSLFPGAGLSAEAR